MTFELKLTSDENKSFANENGKLKEQINNLISMITELQKQKLVDDNIERPHINSPPHLDPNSNHELSILRKLNAG